MNKKQYIELESALKANCYFCSAHLEDDSPCVEKCADYMKFIEIPIADVQPVVSGKWILKDDGRAHCSMCDAPGNSYVWNFCPNCGARMNKDSDDNG